VEEDDAERESPPVPAPAVAAAAAGAVGGGGGGAIWDGGGSMLLLAVVVVPVPVLWLGLTPSTVIAGLSFGLWLWPVWSWEWCVWVCQIRMHAGMFWGCLLCCRLGLANHHHHSFGAADLIERSIESSIDDQATPQKRVQKGERSKPPQ